MSFDFHELVIFTDEEQLIKKSEIIATTKNLTFITHYLDTQIRIAGTCYQ